MASELHQERLDTVVRHLRASGARSVLDLGCGEGELLQLLARHRQFDRLLGIDIDEHALRMARQGLDLGLEAGHGRLQIQHGSFETPDDRLSGFDAGILLETIEHVDPRRLSLVERAVFGRMQPGIVLVTTPNQEYNVVHHMAPGEMRHPGHYFEWSRARFRKWARGIAVRHDYLVKFFDIGPAHPQHGSTTQMAKFVYALARRGSNRNVVASALSA